MKTISAFNNQILEIDLSTGNISRLPVKDEDRRLYLGGKGLALKYLYDNLKPGVEPLSAESILVLMGGPTAGTAAPTGGRFAVVGKSPLTGIFASSFVGGRFGISLKKAGYDGVAIRGKSDSPVFIKINDSDVSIEDAGSLWGMDTYEIQDNNKDAGDWIVIGPAGENLVKYAAISAGRHYAGRCGLGAVMGFKNLKGLVATGSNKIKPANPDLFAKALSVARPKIKAHSITGTDLRELGTPHGVMVYGIPGITPVRNFSCNSFDFEKISGEHIKSEHFVKNYGCMGCSIICGRTAKFKGQLRISPQYETLALLGSNLEIDDVSHNAEWNEIVNRLGIDSISAGNVLGFVMEMTEKGLMKSNLSFGNPEGVSDALKDIAFRRGLGDDMAEGVRSLSKKYGGTEFAIHVKGQEMAGYDPRGCSGQGLGYATANSGATHLSGSTHAIEIGNYLDQHGTKGKPNFVKFLQDLNDAVNSAVFCIQIQFPFLEENFMYKNTPRSILRFFMRNFPAIATATTDLTDFGAILSGLMGYNISGKDFYKVGERTFNLERLMNTREGISRKDDTLPERLLTESGRENWPVIELESMLKKYYKLRKWDADGGVTDQTLAKLNIQKTQLIK